MKKIDKLHKKQKRGKTKNTIRSKRGMEMVQVGILVAIAIVIGLIFKSEIMSFVNNTFSDLNSGF